MEKAVFRCCGIAAIVLISIARRFPSVANVPRKKKKVVKGKQFFS